MHIDQPARRNIQPTWRRLARENRAYRDTGGVSKGNRASGFVPAFKDQETGAIYPSCFANGELAPFHSLEGLPRELLVFTGVDAPTVKDSLVSGFLRGGRFYTRDQAARWVGSHGGLH